MGFVFVIRGALLTGFWKEKSLFFLFFLTIVFFLFWWGGGKGRGERAAREPTHSSSPTRC